MERISPARTSGIPSNTLRTFGILFAACGIVGQSILQNKLLGIGSVSSQALLEAMQRSGSAMAIATVALIAQAIETCAVPVFAFLLVEGFQHTKDLRRYFLRILGAAALSELPYNFAMRGKLLDPSAQNPVFGLVLGLALLYWCRKFGERSAKQVLGRIAITLAALVWPVMLNIQYGSATVLMVAVLWAMRNKPNFRGMVGAAGIIACSLFSPFFLAAPMSFLAIHFYNGERGAENRLVNYLAYPVLLLAAGLIGLTV